MDTALKSHQSAFSSKVNTLTRIPFGSTQSSPSAPRLINKNSEIWVEILSTRSAPGLFTPARLRARTKTKSIIRDRHLDPDAFSLPAAQIGSRKPVGKRKALGQRAGRRREESDSDDGGVTIFTQKNPRQSGARGKKGNRSCPRARPSPKKQTGADKIHKPLFQPPVEAVDDFTEAQVECIPESIQFIIFCHAFAEFVGWQKMNVQVWKESNNLIRAVDLYLSFDPQVMEEELRKGDSIYIIDIIIKLLRKIASSNDIVTVSNWEIFFRNQATIRKRKTIWPPDFPFAELDIRTRVCCLSRRLNRAGWDF